MPSKENMNGYYTILGLTRGASKKEIKKAFWEKAMVCHPDHNKNNPEAEEEFKKIAEAYGVLCEAWGRKQKYNSEHDPLMCTRQRLPDYFDGQSVQTWANLASQGRGPRYWRRGKLCWYVVSQVRDYLMQTPIQTAEVDY